jgi:hypothetical protein
MMPKKYNPGHSPLNESTLEARVHRVLSNVFPTFHEINLVHQESFTLSFGHNTVSINAAPSTANHKRGRFDILLTVDGENSILLELKQEGQPLTTHDIDQGISYARLLHPMPPLTLISNGRDNWFINTYSKERIDESIIDTSLLKRITDNSFILASNDSKNAIENLLGKDHQIFSQIVMKLTQQKFIRLIGPLENLNQPICKEFSIRRTLMDAINQQFATKESLVGVIGLAFSGKTNLLYQYCNEIETKGQFVYFVDCYDDNFSIFQDLANHFAKFTGVLITKDKVREWLLNSIISSENIKFYLLIDNFNNDLPSDIRAEIMELIQMFKGGQSYILYTTDEYNFLKLAYTKDRKLKTTIGNQTKLLRLNELNDQEFEDIHLLMFNQFRVGIEHGGQFAGEYRQLRLLRYLTSLYYDATKTDRYSRIIAVPDKDHMLALANNSLFTPKIKEYYESITRVFLGQQSERDKNSFLDIVASGSGAVTKDGFQKAYPKISKKLSRSSLIMKRRAKRVGEVLYPKIPELIAERSIKPITDKLIAMAGKGSLPNEVCEELLRLIRPFPYSDIVGTLVLIRFAFSGQVDLFSTIIQILLKSPPTFEAISEGTRTLMYDEDAGHILLSFQDGMDERDGGFISNFLPFAILSQIAGDPLRLVDSDEYDPLAFHLMLLYTVGSSPEFLLRPEVRSLQNMRPIEHFEFTGIGKIISGKQGIIEPIVQSLQKCFMQIPLHMDELCDRAFREDNFPLLWRIYLASRELISITDDNIAQRATSYVNRFNEYFNNFMSEYLTRDIADEKDQEDIRTTLRRFKAD